MYFFLLSCILTLFSGASDVPAPVGLRHERVTFRGTEYDVVWVDLKARELRLCWKDAQGEAFKNFEGLRRELEEQGQTLLFATNAGMYAKDHTPLGLHVEAGQELRALNKGPGGRGNFFLKPNGVFYVAEGGGRVATVDAYEGLAPEPELATQSGPMLVIEGELHPRFLVDATSKYVRNGVGVNEAGEAVFAISRAPVIFHDFGSLYRERLGCANALYLDGSLSGMYAPFAGRHDAGLRYVGMLAVVEARE